MAGRWLEDVPGLIVQVFKFTGVAGKRRPFRTPISPLSRRNDPLDRDDERGGDNY
jgi:hypothetical protein